MDKLWLNSLSDRFSFRQIADPKTRLSRIGLEICRELEKAAGVPVYYYLHCDGNFGRSFPAVCPSCGGEWRSPESPENYGYDYVCEKCRLVAYDSELTGRLSEEERAAEAEQRKNGEELVARALEEEESGRSGG